MSPLDTLLESMKTIFTASGLSFVFVAGKEVQETWSKEVALGDSIYESIFAYDVYLPCLWEKQEDLIASCLYGGARRKQFRYDSPLHDFILYLCYRGRGLPRLLLRELNKHIIWQSDGPVLSVRNELQRIMKVYARLEERLVQGVQVFREDLAHVNSAQQDRRKLSAYYALDWILGRGRNSFRRQELREVVERLNIGPRADLREKEVLPEELLRTLVDGLLIEPVEATIISADVKQLGSYEEYRLAEWVLLALQEAERTPQEQTQTALPPEGLLSAESEALGSQYQVLKKIGEGGFGTVFKVRDGLGREFAAKVLYKEPDSEDGKRFLREIDVLSRLDHPGIVKIVDHGTTHYSIFFVMDYIEGLTLETVKQSLGSLTEQSVVEIGRRLASVYGYVHGKGLVRNDIKPSNIMLDVHGNLTVLDFGTVRVESQEITATGILIGTPAYVAPEAIKGGKSTARSDVYSLGVLLYELLTGNKPFGGDSILGVIHAILQGDPLPPSRLAKVSPSVEQIILRAMSQQPEERFDSMEMLQGILEGLDYSADLAGVARQAFVRSGENAELVEISTHRLARELPSERVESGTSFGEARGARTITQERAATSSGNRLQRIHEIMDNRERDQDPYLWDSVRDPSWEVRRAALAALSALNPPDVRDQFHSAHESIASVIA